MTTVSIARPTRRVRQWRIVAGVLAIWAVMAAGGILYVLGPPLYAIWSYAPQEGDIVFQSLPHSALVNSIEGTTESSFSHCGIVAHQEGRWVIYEALGDVSATPLRRFLLRGREQGFAVYRLKPAHRAHIEATLSKAKDYFGRPYDVRYRLDDEKIYCSELIYKAYRDATEGEKLGRLVRLGDLHWKPYVAIIERFEEGPAPLDREMITPRDLALAEQLELVYAYGIQTPDGDP